MSIFVVFRLCETSGWNSKAPIPRLPMNDSLSSGVMSALAKWFCCRHRSKSWLPQASGNESATKAGNFWYIFASSPQTGISAWNLSIGATKGEIFSPFLMKSGLYVKYDSRRRSSHDKRPISSPQRITFSDLIILVYFLGCLILCAFFSSLRTR